MLSFHKPALT